MGAKKLLLSTLRMRKRLMADKRSYKNPSAIQVAMAPFVKWVSFYGTAKITDEGCAKMLQLHKEKFFFLLPGKNSGTHEKYHNQFMQIIKS